METRVAGRGSPGLERRAALARVALEEGPYRVRFAHSGTDLERVQRLRFLVFNRELGEGLERSWATGRDEDRFDRVCHHLMLEDRASGELVGTYRMQTAAMAAAGEGFYCNTEFDLSMLSPEVTESAVELGRACILEAHRNGLALFALWRGLALYLTWFEKRRLFGCCSLTSQDPRAGVALRRRLGALGKLSSELSVTPRPAHACPDPGEGAPSAIEIPRLLGLYLRYGAEVCGGPAIDRAFRTIDFFILLDVERLDPRVRALFFADLPAPLDFRGEP